MKINPVKFSSEYFRNQTAESIKMKKIFLYGALGVFLFINTACSGTALANTTTTTANKAANANTAVVVNTNTSANTTAAGAASNTAAGNVGSASGSSSASDQDFKLNNKTGVEIHSVYISPSNSDDWEEDILGRDTLPDGENVDVEFTRAEKAPKWDLRVEAKDGSFIVWEDLNLLEISDLTLDYTDGKATAIVK